MTNADTLVAGLIFGAVLMLAGIGVLWLGRSLWSERQAKKAELFMQADDSGAPPFVMQDETRARILADVLARVEMAQLADRLADADTLLWIPAQRERGDVYDVERDGL